MMTHQMRVPHQQRRLSSAVSPTPALSETMGSGEYDFTRLMQGSEASCPASVMTLNLDVGFGVIPKSQLSPKTPPSVSPLDVKTGEVADNAHPSSYNTKEKDPGQILVEAKPLGRIITTGGLHSLSLSLDYHGITSLNEDAYDLGLMAMWGESDASDGNGDDQRKYQSKSSSSSRSSEKFAPMPLVQTNNNSADLESSRTAQGLKSTISSTRLKDRNFQSGQRPGATAVAVPTYTNVSPQISGEAGMPSNGTTDGFTGAQMPHPQAPILKPRSAVSSDPGGRHVNQGIFWRRTLTKQEREADLECFEALGLITAFFKESHEKQDDSDALSSSIHQRMSMRHRRARIVGAASPVEMNSLSRISEPTPSSQRKERLQVETRDELFSRVLECYRRAGVRKAYLDILRVKCCSAAVNGGADDSHVAEYSSMLEFMTAETQPLFFQNNALSTEHVHLLQRSGMITFGGSKSRLEFPLWDDKDFGFLASDIFAARGGLDEVFLDPCSEIIYAEELNPSNCKFYGTVQLCRQHDAPESRVVAVDGGKQLRGRSVIRDARPLDMIDGRCTTTTPRFGRYAAVYASLQVLAHYQSIFDSMDVIGTLLYPQDIFGCTVINPVYGKYCVPLLLNGATRMVEVDDRVPVDMKTKEWRCITCRTPELYPTLLEKALLKSHGCQLAPSLQNSSSILHQLCGWIPQTLEIRNSKDLFPTSLYLLDPVNWWSSLLKQFRNGKVVITMRAPKPGSTTPRRHARRGTEAEPTPLLVFSVLDMCEEESASGPSNDRIRAVVLRDNSTRLGQRDAGADVVPPFTTTLTKEALQKIGFKDQLRSSGIFCLRWEEVLAHCSDCCLSWNPFVLWSGIDRVVRPTRLSCHATYFRWVAGRALGQMPQFHIGTIGVRQSTRMFLVFSRHVTNFADSPSGMLAPKVGIRIYEMTSLPSLIQSKMHTQDGSEAVCCFGDCIARRLTCESESPQQLKPLNIVQGSRDELFTVEFDCLPGNRNFVVVCDVMDFSSHSVVGDFFTYTLTLYSKLTEAQLSNPRNIPTVSPRHTFFAQQGSGDSVDGTGGADRVGSVFFHSIPESSDISSASMQGQWCGGDSTNRRLHLRYDKKTEELCCGAQYTLTLPRPEFVSVRLCPRPINNRQSSTTDMKLLLVRKAEQRSRRRRGSSEQAGGILSDVMAESDLVLCSGPWSRDGAVVDSVSAHTLLKDTEGRLIPQPSVVRREFHTTVRLSVVTQPDAQSKSVSIVHPDPQLEMRALVLQAFAAGHLISPHACAVTLRGAAVPLSERLQNLITPANVVDLRSSSDGAEATILEQFMDVQVKGTVSASSINFRPTSPASMLVKQLQRVVSNAWETSPTQTGRLLPPVEQVLLEVGLKVFNDAHLSFVQGLAQSIKDWLLWHHKCLGGPPPVHLTMPRLPAGEYIIIPCVNSSRKSSKGGLGKTEELSFSLTIDASSSAVDVTVIAGTVKSIQNADMENMPLHSQHTSASSMRQYRALSESASSSSFFHRFSLTRKGSRK